MKVCPKCKIEKDETNYWKTCSYCKKCQKEHWRNRIDKNKDAYAARRKELRFKKDARNCLLCQKLFIGSKQKHCCTLCAFNDQILKRKNGCWEWQGLLNAGGYGQITDYEKQKRFMAHRYSYLQFKGEIPEGMHVCHHCDNPKCCAPSHLFLGTDKDNMEDCKRKGRTAKGDKVAQKGEKNFHAIFTNELVLQIREMCSQGLKDRDISEKLGSDKYSVYQINAIRHRRSWKHI